MGGEAGGLRIRAMDTEQREERGPKQTGNKEDEKKVEKEEGAKFFKLGLRRRTAAHKTSASDVLSVLLLLNLTVGLI